MLRSLKEETALVLEDYFQYRSGSTASPCSPTAAVLRRVAAELERKERAFFLTYASLARVEPREAAALLGGLAAQLEVDGGLNWGRLVALVVFAGTLAAALVERGCSDGPRCLAVYLAEERGEWLEANGGWDGFCCFFRTQGSEVAEQTVSIVKFSILAAVMWIGLAGLFFLLLK